LAVKREDGTVALGVATCAFGAAAFLPRAGCEETGGSEAGGEVALKLEAGGEVLEALADALRRRLSLEYRAAKSWSRGGGAFATISSIIPAGSTVCGARSGSRMQLFSPVR
jgi:hypothetical protein